MRSLFWGCGDAITIWGVWGAIAFGVLGVRSLFWGCGDAITIWGVWGAIAVLGMWEVRSLWGMSDCFWGCWECDSVSAP
ncbi:hypothetical protein [Anabaena sp. AL09]|uniref:hypothetical protein n=1 Tax=Anabaena sp. AL09 TaxID=1710891 RepID=UPI0007FC8146|nr:hypothetical protein [Anabaena sp. AL09]OBQ12847.1 MAG: hypothetical protein AN490_03900 [Anabaena sp. AL09]